jgi:hypothetical protein
MSGRVLYGALLVFIGVILLSSRSDADTDSGLREYRLFHGPCLGSGGEEVFVGDVLVKYIGGKSRGKFQPAADASLAKGCSAGGLTRSKLRDESGNEWISSFLAVGTLWRACVAYWLTKTFNFSARMSRKRLLSFIWMPMVGLRVAN